MAKRHQSVVLASLVLGLANAGCSTALPLQDGSTTQESQQHNVVPGPAPAADGGSGSRAQPPLEQPPVEQPPVRRADPRPVDRTEPPAPDPEREVADKLDSDDAGQPAGVACGPASPPKTMPKPSFNLAAAAAPDGRIFVVAGATEFETNQARLALTLYDPRDASYHDLPAAPFGAVGWPSAAFVSGRVVVSADSVGSYDIETQRWTTSASAGARLLNRAAVAGPDGRAYFFGGLSDQGGMVDSADAYDPLTDTWSALPPMPFSVDGAAAASVNGLLYVVGPRAAVFDPKAQKWSTVATPLTPRYWLGAAADAQGRVVAIGGYPAGGTGSSAVVELYDPSSNRWTSGGTLNVPVAQMGITASCSGGIYLFGGDSNGQLVGTVQVLAGDRWTASE